MTEFKFKIGDHVKFADVRRGEFLTARIFRIVARKMDECPGGVQLQYQVRDVDHLSEVSWVHEFELESWTEEDSVRFRRRAMEDCVKGWTNGHLVTSSLVIEAEMRRRSAEAAESREVTKTKSCEECDGTGTLRGERGEVT